MSVPSSESHDGSLPSSSSEDSTGFGVLVLRFGGMGLSGAVDSDFGLRKVAVLLNCQQLPCRRTRMLAPEGLRSHSFPELLLYSYEQ